ncbi:MAG TPA: c-type cytochrome, partial [Gemmataceae bacterium]
MSWRSIDLKAGQKLFAAHCASCHSLTEAGARYGPSLYKIGEVGNSRLAGMDTEEYIFRSIVEPSAYRAPGSLGEMPENVADDFSRDELLSLTAFLCSQGGLVRYSRLVKLDRIPGHRQEAQQEVPLNSVERGRALFEAVGCAHCHALTAFPGADLLAPKLDTAGRHSRAYLEQKILKPSKQIKPEYEQWIVTRGGRSHSGRRLPGPVGVVRLLTLDDGEIRIRNFKEAELTADEEEEGLVKSPI